MVETNKLMASFLFGFLTKERGARRVCDAYPHPVADVMTALVQHNGLVLGRASHELTVRTLAETLYEHLKLPAFVGLVTLGRGGCL